MLIIPLEPVPSQQVSVELNNQSCKINVYQRTTGLFVDLYMDDDLLVGGVLALNSNLIVRFLYLGFVGDLAIVNLHSIFSTQVDPSYSGLGSQFVLVYLLPSEVPAFLTPKVNGYWSPTNPISL